MVLASGALVAAGFLLGVALFFFSAVFGFCSADSALFSLCSGFVSSGSGPNPKNAPGK
jgi:hypothetical protein